MVKRLALALLVLFVTVLLAVYWGVRVSQKAVVPELKPSRHVVERFIDNPDSIHFSRDGLTFELYDLENDPLERLNLSQLRKEQVSKMYSAWLGFIDDQKKHREAFVLLGESERSSKPIPQDLIDRLRSLGYINQQLGYIN